MDWRSNAAVDTLTKYVTMRVPYPDIAKRMGTSTGSICGKVHRLGIGKGPRNPDRLYVKASKARKPQLTPDAAYFAIMERQEEEAEARQGLTIALETSEDHHCRYIIGDPVHRQLCGIRRVVGTPYCEEHGALCLSRPTFLGTLPAPHRVGERREDLSGRKYGLLAVLHYSGHDGHHNGFFVCKCDCGKFSEVRGANLKAGDVVSCGCYNASMSSDKMKAAWFKSPLHTKRGKIAKFSAISAMEREDCPTDAPEPATVAA